MTQRVLFRVDGAQRLGTGHVMRCLTLAQAFAARGVAAAFVMRDEAPEIQARAAAQGYPVTPLASDTDAAADAAATLAAAKACGAGVIVTDLSNSDWLSRREDYQRLCSELSRGNCYLAAFDDPSATDITCNLKIIPYLDVAVDPDLNRNAGRLLVGQQYFVIREEFRHLTDEAREVRDTADTVLVTMGGSDPRSLTARAVRALLSLNLNLIVVTGMAFSPALLAEVRELMRGRGEVIHQAADMAALMQRADLVISAGGLTKYEAAAAGAPLLLLAQNEFEASKCQTFAQHGIGVHLGLGAEAPEAEIARATRELLDDAARRRQMSARGRVLIDGQGAERIVDVILSEAGK